MDPFATLFSRLHQLRWSAVYQKPDWDVPLWPLAYPASRFQVGPDEAYDYYIDYDPDTRRFSMYVNIREKNKVRHGYNIAITTSHEIETYTSKDRSRLKRRIETIVPTHPRDQARVRAFVRRYLERYAAWMSSPLHEVHNTVTRYSEDEYEDVEDDSDDDMVNRHEFME